jgi:hypothetical protein
MENTNCGKNCTFVKIGLCESDTDCPNFVETLWQCGEGAEIKTVKDCSPKRQLLESQKYILRHLEIEAKIKRLTEKVENLESLLIQLIYESRQFLGQVNKKQLEEKNDRINS